MKTDLKDEFGDDVEVTGEVTKKVSGSFEVYVGEDKDLVHSKEGGEGFVDSKAKLANIVNAIREILDE